MSREHFCMSGDYSVQRERRGLSTAIKQGKPYEKWHFSQTSLTTVAQRGQTHWNYRKQKQSQQQQQTRSSRSDVVTISRTAMWLDFISRILVQCFWFIKGVSEQETVLFQCGGDKTPVCRSDGLCRGGMMKMERRERGRRTWWWRRTCCCGDL